MDLSKIEELIALMRESGLSQLALEEPGYRVSITRGQERPGCAPGAVQGEPSLAAGATAGGPAGAGAARPAVTTGPGVSADPSADAPDTTLTVIAPVVGVFRNGGAVTGKKPLEVGVRVQRGQLLAVIEAMKVPNEVRSPVEGVVTAVAVEDGGTVEYGQTLFVISPEEGGEEDEEENGLGVA